MTLKELIKNNSFSNVKQKMKEIYPKESENNFEGYKVVYNKLTSMIAQNNKMIIVIKQVVDYDKSEFTTIYGIKSEKDSTYTLDFTEWKKWLGMEIDKVTLKQYSELEIIARCLWEMTFYGFNENDAKEKLDELDKIIEKIGDDFDE